MEVIESVHSIQSESVFEFSCTACAYRGMARLKVVAEGAAVVNATREDAAVVAQRRAEAGTARASSRARLIVRCPRCGAFDPARLAEYRRGRAAVFALLLVFGGAAVGIGLTFPAWRGAGMVVGLPFLLSALQPVWQALRPPAVEVVFT